MKKKLIRNIQDTGISSIQQTQLEQLKENVNNINNSITQIQQKNTEQDNALNNKANLTANTFTQPQTINNSKALILNNNATLMEITDPGEKNVYLDFIQPKAGFRNYANIYFRVKHGSTANWENILKIQSRNTGTGLFLEVEANKLGFLNPTTISNIDTPTADGDAVNKSYVDGVKTNITTNTNEINTLKQETTTIKADLGDLGNQVVDVQNKANENKTNIATLTQTTTNTTNLLNNVINDLRDLRPFHYVGAFTPGTTYKRNDLVSKGNDLYLSSEDNNTTTPPGSKWVLMQSNDVANVDLSNYYTRNEIDAQQQAQDTKITNNTNALNNVVKTSQNQTINGEKTFTSPLTMNNSIAVKRNGGSMSVVEIVNQGEKHLNFDFVQPATGFRNYANLNLRIKYGSNANYTNLFKIQSRDVGTGIFLEAENNKIEFINATKIANVQDPTSANDVANKQYVDAQSNNNVKTSGDQTINGNKTFNGTTTFGQRIEAGVGSTTFNITPEDNTNKVIKFSGVNGKGRFDLDMNGVSKIQNLPVPEQDSDAASKFYVDRNFVSKTQNDDISGYKSFTGHVRIVNDFSLGLVNEAPIIGGSNYSFSNGKLKKTDNKQITHNDELVTKGYVDYEVSSRLSNINSIIETKVNQLIQPLKDYAKTGIIQFQIIDFNQGRFRIKWIQKPLGWNDSNVLLNRIHLSGQRYDVARDDVWTEFSAGGFQEWNNVKLNPNAEFTTNQLNNNIFKDFNLASTIYMWLDWNTQLVESDVPTKIQVPAAFRYEKNGYSWYVPFKMK